MRESYLNFIRAWKMLLIEAERDLRKTKTGVSYGLLSAASQLVGQTEILLTRKVGLYQKSDDLFCPCWTHCQHHQCVHG